MDANTQLGLLATIAATYSGFIAVFIAFTKDGRFEAADAHFVQAMVLGTIGVIVMSLTPPVLVLMMPRATAWYWVTAFAVSAGVLAFLFQAIQQMNMPTEERGKVKAVWHIPGWALGVASLACFFGALAWPNLREGFYVAGVSFNLAIAIWCFIAIVFRKFF